jgi:hypothetical protein
MENNAAAVELVVQVQYARLKEFADSPQVLPGTAVA